MPDPAISGESSAQPRSVSRYRDFRREDVKVHPLRKLAGEIARLLPRRWRLTVTGLPTRAGGTLENLAPPWERPAVTKNPRGMATRVGANLDESGSYVPEVTLGAGAFIETRFLQRQRFFPRIRKVKGRVLSLTFEAQINYYRWLMETLPRLRFAVVEHVDCDWIYACQRSPFHRETLRLLGYEAGRIISTEDDPIIRADEIVVPRFVDESEPWIIPWLRKKFLPLAPTPAAPRPRRFYLMRGRSSSRRSSNEAELLTALGRFGFIAVTAEDLTWVEQVALFRDAEAIVAPHGAGLANVAFCSAGALVIELIAEGYPFTFFPVMGRRVGLTYHRLDCPAADAARVAGSDIRVDVAAVMEIVERWDGTGSS